MGSGYVEVFDSLDNRLEALDQLVTRYYKDTLGTKAVNELDAEQQRRQQEEAEEENKKARRRRGKQGLVGVKIRGFKR